VFRGCCAHGAIPSFALCQWALLAYFPIGPATPLQYCLIFNDGAGLSPSPDIPWSLIFPYGQMIGAFDAKCPDGWKTVCPTLDLVDRYRGIDMTHFSLRSSVHHFLLVVVATRCLTVYYHYWYGRLVRLVLAGPRPETQDNARNPANAPMPRHTKRHYDKGENISVLNAQSTERLGQIGNYEHDGARAGAITSNALMTRARLKSSAKKGLQESSCTTWSICGPVCPSRMLPNNTKNSFTRDLE